MDLPVDADEDAEAAADGGHDLAVHRHRGRGHALHHSLHLDEGTRMGLLKALKKQCKICHKQAEACTELSKKEGTWLQEMCSCLTILSGF